MKQITKNKGGRPRILKAGKAHRIYLDAASLSKARRIGATNASAGIRIAVAAYRGKSK